MKLKFTSTAKARTTAPNQWQVLISQRRRWINSTVHNLFELLMIRDLCGCFFFSMRFIVLFDLLTTLLSPAGFVYIMYLIVSIATEDDAQIPYISLIMIAAIYGLQVIIFVIRQEFQHIGWMVALINIDYLYSGDAAVYFLSAAV